MIILFMFCVFYNKQSSNRSNKSKYLKKHNIYNNNLIAKKIYISVPKDFPISFNNIKYLLGYPPAGYQYEIYYGYKLNHNPLNNGIGFNQILNISKNLTKKGINNSIIAIDNSYTISIDKMTQETIEIDNGLSDVMDTDIILKDIYSQGFMAKKNKYLLESSKAYSQSANFINYHLYLDKKKNEYILKNKTKVIKDINIYSQDADNIYNTTDLASTPIAIIANILDYMGLGTKYYKNIDMNNIINACNRVKNDVNMNILVNDLNEVTIHIENDIKDYKLNEIIISNSIGWLDGFIISLLVSANPNITANELNKNTSKNCHITHLEKDFFSDNEFNLQIISIDDLSMYQSFIKSINIISNYSLKNNQKIQKSINSKVFLPIEYINMLTGAYQHMSGHKDLNPDISGHDLNLVIPVPKKELLVNKDNIMNRFGSKNGKISLDVLQKYWINYKKLYHVKLSYLSIMAQNKDIKSPVKLIKNISLAPKIESKKSLIIGNVMHYLTFNLMWSGLKPILLLDEHQCLKNSEWNVTKEEILLDLSNVNFSYDHRLPLGINSDLNFNMEINTNNTSHYAKYKDLYKKIDQKLMIESLQKIENQDKGNQNTIKKNLINQRNIIKSKNFFRQMMSNNMLYNQLYDKMNVDDVNILDTKLTNDDHIGQILFKPQVLCFLKFSYRLITTSAFNVEFNIKNQFNKKINNNPEIYYESTLDFILDRPNNRNLHSLSLYTVGIIKEKYSLKDHAFSHQYSLDKYSEIIKFDNIIGTQSAHISPIITSKKLLGQNILGLYFAALFNCAFIANAQLKKKTNKSNIMLSEVAIGIILSIMGVINLMLCIYIGLDHEGKLQYDLDFKKVSLVASQLSQKLLRL